MSLLNTYTADEKEALAKHKLTNDKHSVSSDCFVLGMRYNVTRLTEIAAAKATRCDELFEELERITEQFGEFVDALDKSPAEYSAYVSSKQLLEKIRNESCE